jgi:histidinol-phosphatase
MPDSEVSARLTAALRGYEFARVLILRHYRDADLSVELKKDQTPVTAADRGAEELLREFLGKEFPDDAILGEEFGETTGTSGYRWILDPVDGTKSFIARVPLFGTLIGLEYQGRSVAGICGLPALDEIVYAEQGGGTWWKHGNAPPRSCRVTPTAALSDAMLCFTSLGSWEYVGRQKTMDYLTRTCRLTRGWGDCFGHILVATGRADVMIDPQLSLWDAAALVPILQEAGGHFLDWTGAARADGGSGVSVNAALKDEVIALLSKPDGDKGTRTRID